MLVEHTERAQKHWLYLLFSSQRCLPRKVFTAANGLWKLSWFHSFKINPPAQVVQPLTTLNKEAG